MVSPQNLHFTVKFLGDISESKAKKIYFILKEEINEKMFEETPFKYNLKGVGQFRNYSVLWINILGDIEFLRSLKNTTEDLLFIKLHIQKERRSKFKPHLTIGRLRKKRIYFNNFNQFKDIINENKNREFGTFFINKITLKKSVLTPKGPIYSDLVY